ncbi:hypothetical protein EJB05_27039, partial [Eragrostis curvula]
MRRKSCAQAQCQAVLLSNQEFEVRMREDGAVNIHMSALQAVISCFNGFSLDVFKDEVMYNCSHLLPTTFIHTDRVQGVAGWLALDAQGDQALVGGAVAAVERQDVVHHRFHGRSAGAGSVEEKTSFGGALQAGVVSEGFDKDITESKNDTLMKYNLT